MTTTWVSWLACSARVDVDALTPAQATALSGRAITVEGFRMLQTPPLSLPPHAAARVVHAARAAPLSLFDAEAFKACVACAREDDDRHPTRERARRLATRAGADDEDTASAVANAALWFGADILRVALPRRPIWPALVAAFENERKI